MKNTALQRTQTKGNSKSTTHSGLDVVSVTSIGVMGAVSAFVGTWAVVSFTAALMNVGPFEMVKSFFSAITGM